MDWTRRLRLNHLHLLITLHETGSLSDAARASHGTQPGLSKWLRELEEDVGGPLFERHARGLTPTPMGLLLIGHARRMVTQMSRAQHDLEALLEGSSRTFAVGTSPASAPSFVPAAIMQFLELHPKARMEFQEGTMNDLLEKLELGKLDVVVGRLDNYQPRTHLSSEKLYDEPLRIMSRPDHPLAKRKDLTWDDIYAYDWIVWPRGTPIRSKLEVAITRAGLKPPPYRVESSSQVGNLWLLQYSDMLAVGSERVARHFTGRGLVVPLDISIDSEVGFVGMCWREDSGADAAMLELLECFRSSQSTD